MERSTKVLEVLLCWEQVLCAALSGLLSMKTSHFFPAGVYFFQGLQGHRLCVPTGLRLRQDSGSPGTEDFALPRGATVICSHRGLSICPIVTGTNE